MSNLSLVLLTLSLISSILSSPQPFAGPKPSRTLQKRQSTLDQGPFHIFNITILVANAAPTPAFNSSISFIFVDPTPGLQVSTYCNWTINGTGQPSSGQGGGYVHCQNNDIGFNYWGQDYGSAGWIGTIEVEHLYLIEQEGVEWAAGAFGSWNVTPHEIMPAPAGGALYTQSCLDIYIDEID
jgi:hypothetical protein